MEDHLFQCRHCKKIRRKRRYDQQYCGREACQKARNNAWRRAKNEADPDYRANQRASTKAWLAAQGGAAAYYRRYRRRRKEQREAQACLADNTDRADQQAQARRADNACRADQQAQARRADNAGRADQQAQTSPTTESANSNAKAPQSCVISGRYRLSPCDSANSNAIFYRVTKRVQSHHQAPLVEWTAVLRPTSQGKAHALARLRITLRECGVAVQPLLDAAISLRTRT